MAASVCLYVSLHDSSEMTEAVVTKFGLVHIRTLRHPGMAVIIHRLRIGHTRLTHSYLFIYCSSMEVLFDNVVAQNITNFIEKKIPFLSHYIMLLPQSLDLISFLPYHYNYLLCCIHCF